MGAIPGIVEIISRADPAIESISPDREFALRPVG